MHGLVFTFCRLIEKLIDKMNKEDVQMRENKQTGAVIIV
jgi:hypothetical protein